MKLSLCIMLLLISVRNARAEKAPDLATGKPGSAIKGSISMPLPQIADPSVLLEADDDPLLLSPSAQAPVKPRQSRARASDPTDEPVQAAPSAEPVASPQPKRIELGETPEPPPVASPAPTPPKRPKPALMPEESPITASMPEAPPSAPMPEMPPINARGPAIPRVRVNLQGIAPATIKAPQSPAKAAAKPEPSPQSSSTPEKKAEAAAPQVTTPDAPSPVAETPAPAVAVPTPSAPSVNTAEPVVAPPSDPLVTTVIDDPPPGAAPAPPPVPMAVEAPPAQLPLAMPLPVISSSFQRRPSMESALPPFPAGPEIAIVLALNRFYPSRIRLRAGEATRLVFTTVNRKPAALVVEQLQIQRWVSRGPASTHPWEITRELSANRITEIVIEPKLGSYSFHDALTGAVGEIIVE